MIHLPPPEESLAARVSRAECALRATGWILLNEPMRYPTGPDDRMWALGRDGASAPDFIGAFPGLPLAMSLEDVVRWLDEERWLDEQHDRAG